MDDKNKKMGLWVLLAVVVLGAGFYFVSKNSSNLVAINNEVTPRTQTATFTVDPKDSTKCTSTNFSGTGSIKYDANGKAYCTLTVLGVDINDRNPAIGIQPVGTGTGPDTGTGTVNPYEYSVSLPDMSIKVQSQNIFTDWTVYNHKAICPTSFAQVSPLLADPSISNQFVLDLIKNAKVPSASALPWSGASVKCGIAQ